MKKTLLLLVSVLALQSAIAQDTVTVTVCTELWKANQPITATQIGAYATPPPTSSIVGMLDSTQSCVDFTYIVSQYAPDATFSFGASKNQDLPLNGVNMLDLIDISKHILGLEILPTFGMIAADANKSNSITTFDIVEIQKLILGIYQEFPNNDVWRFIPEYSLPFPNPNNPFQGTLGVTSLTLSELQALNSKTIVLVGVKTGDVNGDANTLTPFVGSSGDSTALKIPDLMLQAGVPTIIPISIQTNTPLDAMQLEIKGLGDVALEKVTVDPMYNAYFISNSGVGPVNEIRAMLQDINHDLAQVPTLYLHLTANTTIALKEVLQIDQSNFSSFLLHNTSKVSRLYFDFSGSVATENPIGQNLQILAAQPNPFIDRAQVTIALGQSESVLFEVMDVTGKLLFSEKTMLAAGKHNMTIPGDRIPQSGIVLYRISAGQDNTTGKIMKL